MATARPQRLRYVPLETVRRWDRNPKRHELDDLKESFRRHGFRGAIEFDGTLEAVVAGNGRDEALEQMRDAGEDPPRWIPKDKKGRWLIPVIFGIDADSRDAAEQYGVDANSLTLGLPKIVSDWTEALTSTMQLEVQGAKLRATGGAGGYNWVITGADGREVELNQDQARAIGPVMGRCSTEHAVEDGGALKMSRKAPTQDREYTDAEADLICALRHGGDASLSTVLEETGIDWTGRPLPDCVSIWGRGRASGGGPGRRDADLLRRL